MQAIFDLPAVRAKFPALASDNVFLDNAGGTQILGSVVERLADYLKNTNVQPVQNSYPLSLQAAERLRLSRARLAELINAAHHNEIILGASTTLLLHLLSTSIAKTWRSGDEIIVTDCDHEANIGPWERLRERGAVIRMWQVRADDYQLHLEDLEPLLNDRTRLVCLTHCSNVLGRINPVKTVAAMAHSVGAKICVDGVAFAPHRRIDVQELDADFYALSFYKTFGPHQAVLYGKLGILNELPGINHGFIAECDVPYKFQPGNANFELSYGSAGIVDYLEWLGEAAGPQLDARRASAFNKIADHEEILAARLLDFLNARNDVRIIGDRTADRDTRVSLISFVVEGRDSRDIVEHIDCANIGIRCGDLYARRFFDRFKFASNGGILRASMVHYNTVKEVDLLAIELERAMK